MRQAWRFCGGILEVGDRASGADSGSGVTVRLDFNPQNADALALQSLSAFIDGASMAWTRVDVALDYAMDLSSCGAYHDSLRKTATYGVGADCSGWTFGSRRGERYTRVYDKKRERVERGCADDELLAAVGPNGHLWRVEVECRPHGGLLLPSGLFAGLHLRYLTTEPVGWRELAVVRCCMDDPLFLKRIPTDGGTRSRYRRIVEDCSRSLYPSPHAVYESHREELLGQIWLIEALMNGGSCAVA